MLVAQQNVVTTGKACRLSTVVNGDAGVGSNPTHVYSINFNGDCSSIGRALVCGTSRWEFKSPQSPQINAAVN